MMPNRWMTWAAAIAVCFAATRAGAESASQAIEVTATILPRLELTVTPETGTRLELGAVTQPAEGEQASPPIAVKVAVFSNLGHPYQVTQLVRRPLTNAEGAVIPDEQFRVAAREAAAPTPITPGRAITLYQSDALGKSNSFEARYDLAVTPATPAGTFSTEIVYTVTSL